MLHFEYVDGKLEHRQIVGILRRTDWPHSGVRTTRQGRGQLSYSPARGYRSSRSTDSAAPVGVRGDGRSQDPPMSSAPPRRDSFPLGHQVPRYSCVVLLAPGNILRMPRTARAAPKSSGMAGTSADRQAVEGSRGTQN
jgi:hypothetical protein